MPLYLVCPVTALSVPVVTAITVPYSARIQEKSEQLKILLLKHLAKSQHRNNLSKHEFKICFKDLKYLRDIKLYAGLGDFRLFGLTAGVTLEYLRAILEYTITLLMW